MYVVITCFEIGTAEDMVEATAAVDAAKIVNEGMIDGVEVAPPAFN